MPTIGLRLGQSLALAAATPVLGAAILAACVQNDRPTMTANANPASCRDPQPIPASYGYPAAPADLKKWVDHRDAAATRAHGWNLWAALVSGNGTPVWRTWCTATQAFAQTAADPTRPVVAARPAHGERPMRTFKLQNGLTSGGDPINFPDAPVYAIPAPVMARYKGTGCILPPSANSRIATLAQGPTLQNNGDILVAGVAYSNDAYHWIRDKKLYETSTLTGLRPAPDKIRHMAPMPDTSIALKPMMWPVQASGYTALPVWDDLTDDHGMYSGYENQQQWKRAVAITPQSTGAATPVSVTFLHGVTMHALPLRPITYPKATPVGLDKFYHYQPDLKTIATCDRAILDASAYYAFGRMFQQGDHLALIAMHIMTKEQPSWTFQSLWWHDRPDTGPYAANRPSIPQASGPWAHYLMTSTYGWPDKKGGDSWPVAYNPYIELAADHPIRTNCVNCHHRAAWPGQADSYQATGGPDALRMFSQDNQKIFPGKIGVDSLWSISDRVPGPKSPPLPSQLPAVSTETQ